MAKKNDRDLIDRAVKCYKTGTDDWYSNHSEMKEDVEFLNGNQPNRFFGRNQQAYNENNPEVNVDLLSQPISHLENIMRSNDYSMAVHRNTDQIDPDFLQVLQGKLKSIEVDSDYKQQYIKAAGKGGALVPGVGFIKVYTEEMNNELPEPGKPIDPNIFNQRIRFKGIGDIFKIIPDFSAQDVTFSDANWWCEYEVYTEEQYEDKFGDSELATSSIGPPTGEKMALYSDHSYTVLKFWYKEKTSKTVYEWANGAITASMKERPVRIIVDPADGQQYEQPIPMRRSRDVESCKIKWIVTNGYEILDRGEWHNSEFPFVGFVGNSCYVSGKRKYYGAIRFTKSSQLMYNFYAAQTAKRLATSSVTPWMAEAEQVGDDKVRQLYENSHYQPTPLLIYKRVMVGGNLIPKPERADIQQPDIHSTSVAMGSTRQDIMSSLGIYDIGMANTEQATGNKINPSGKAVTTLAQQGKLNNLQYTDNFCSSMKRLGELILGLFPYILDTPREETIVAKDGSHKTVWINKEFIDKDTGEKKFFDFDKLKTAQLMVTVDTGPSFADLQSEAIDQITRVVEGIPNGMLLAGDIIARESNAINADILADRIVAMQQAQMPFLAAANMKNIKNMPPAAKSVIAALNGQLQVANKHVTTLAGEVQTLKMEKQAKVVENEGKIKVATIQVQGTLAQERLEIVKEMQMAKEDNHLEALKARLADLDSKRDQLIDVVKHTDKMALEHKKVDKAAGKGKDINNGNINR